MSMTSEIVLQCGGCQAPLSTFIAASVNAERHPHMRQALIDRTLHTFQCDVCGGSNVVEGQFLYVDLARKEFYGVFPQEALAEARSCAETLVRAFDLALGEGAPAAARKLAEGMVVRVCFGLEEVREKIVCRQEGLFDLALEVLKGQVIGESEALRRQEVWTLRLDAVLRDGSLQLLPELGWPGSGCRPGTAVVVSRERYQALAARPWKELCEELPGIASGPHVSLLRLAFGDAAGKSSSAIE